MNETFRILSLDGGGTWALVEARALARIFGEHTPGHEVLRHFHLVVANSGGSIVAAGLAANLTLGTLIGYFRDVSWRKRVFVERSFWERLPMSALPGLRDIAARYESRAKLRGLVQAFPEDFAHLKMDAWRADSRRAALPDFIISAYDYDRRRGRFFRTRPDSPSASRQAPPSVTFLEAVHASSNAPVMFFDVPAEVGGRRYWDGAMAAHNNPIMVGVVEALSHTGAPRPRESVRVLSLGTGTVLNGVPPEAGGRVTEGELRLDTSAPPDLLKDVRKLAQCIIDDPPDLASFVAHVTLGHRLPVAAGERVGDGPVVRMTPWLRAVWRNEAWDYPEGLSPTTYRRLRALDLDAVAPEDVDAIDALCTAWLEGRVPNQPLRSGARFECEVGQETFGDALAQLRTWLPGPV